MSTTTVLAHRLDPNAGEVWRQHTACAAEPARHVIGHGNGAPILAAQAVHICLSHCPVLAPCLARAEAHRPVSVVQGGEWWVRRTKNAVTGTKWVAELPDPGCGPWCAVHRGLPPTVNRKAPK